MMTHEELKAELWRRLVRAGALHETEAGTRVAMMGSSPLFVERAPGGYYVARRTRDGNVNMGRTFSPEGVVAVVEYYRDHPQAWDWRSVSRFLSKIDKVPLYFSPAL